MAGADITRNSPVLHVVVIGFHHKKGCQVEYSYPPLIEGNEVDSHEVPTVWKHLPSLAIPDGAHNYTQDTIFFHLPSRDGNCTTVYGVSCYRQMDASALVNRTADVTRSTVQKSVCVLSRLPLFGLVRAKLELITHAYFEERDFTKVGLLEETYRNLTMSVTEGGGDVSRVFMGMSVRDVVVQFKHKILLLFKLILLERRVLFSGPPVEKLCNTLLSLLSLFPGMIEFGLEEAATSISTCKKISPTMRSTQIGSDEDEFLEIRYHSDSSRQSSPKLDPEMQLSIDTEVSKLNVMEPSSPTIPRGCGEEAGADNPLMDQTYSSNATHAHSRLSQAFVGEDSVQGNSTIIEKDSTETQNVNKNCDMDRNSLLVENNKLEDSEKGCDKDESQGQLQDKTQEEVGGKSSSTSSYISDSDALNNETSFILGMKSTEIGVPHSKPRGESFHSSSPVSPVISPGQVVMSEDNNPLAHISFITQIEAVQTGQMIQNSDSVIDMEEYSEMLDKMDSVSNQKKSSDPELSISLEDSGEVFPKHKLSDSVEELDSPESIQKIDKEDCFSWEEDRLFLSIEHELESSTKESSGEYPENAAEAEKSETGQDPSSRKQSKSSDDDKVVIETNDSTDVNLHSSESSRKKSEEDKITNEAIQQESERKLSSPGSKALSLKKKLSSAFGTVRGKTSRMKRGSSQSSNSSPEHMSTVNSYLASRLQQDDSGFPLVIFSKGNVCHPYLSLQYYDMMQDVNIRAFVIGATNVLFKQKRHLTDVVIDILESRVDFHDRELQKVLNLTTADLRFVDVITKAVVEEERQDDYFDGTEWEGGDEWLRAQFKVYLQSLLVSCKEDDVKHQEDFGMPFVQAFKTTHSYRVWISGDHAAMKDIPVGHPCHGNLGVSDIRMRLSHTMQSTERGKKINAAVSQTGKYMMQTGKVVGGALTQARSAMSSWFSNIGNREPQS